MKKTIPVSPWRWLQTRDLKASGSDSRQVWTLQAIPGRPSRYELDVRLGKPVDILSLKAAAASDFAAHAGRIRESRTNLYSAEDLEEVRRCPVCGASSKKSSLKLQVYGGKYHQCSVCSHCFVLHKPPQRAIDDFYAQDEQYAATYTDKAAAEVRVKQVAVPKAQWVLERFQALYGRSPRSLLDVGSGGGHFVHAARGLGLKAEGIELSRASRAFCRQAFGFELQALDFLRHLRRFREAEVVTFWGVIEHVSEPVGLLRGAHRLLKGRQGLVVAEVPRWDCLSTAVQALFPASVVRHLDPLGHIHCFTDASLATAFHRAGFAPTAAWYFGMDAYELTTQLSHAVGDDRVTHALRAGVAPLQAAMDQAELSDEIVLAGRPL